MPVRVVKNKFYFTTTIFNRLKYEECGKCKQLCHNPTAHQDTGLLTCGGFSYKWFPKVVMQIVNTEWAPYERIIYLKNMYWVHFGLRYHQCNRPAYALIVDSAVNEGHKTAIKRHQRINKLKVDGIWGKQSLKACQKKRYPAQAFTNARIARAKKLPTSKVNFKGWEKRALRKLKEYQNDLQSKPSQNR